MGYYNPERVPSLLRGLTLAMVTYGCLAVLAWQVSGDAAWVNAYFKTPSAVFLIFCALAECSFAYFCFRQFSSDEPMYPAWRLLTMSAACRASGGVLVQCFGALEVGHVMNGPLALTLLGTGLFAVLTTYRKLGVRPKFAFVDLVAIGFCWVHCLNHFRLVYLNVTSPAWTFRLLPVLNWLTDPLLCALLAVALLLRRCAKTMSGGWIAAGWGSYAAGIFLTSLGDLGIWMEGMKMLPPPYEALTWLIWSPAAGTLAMGAAYGWVAMRVSQAVAASVPAESRISR